MGTRKEQIVKEELVELNHKFHKRLLGTEAFYKQLILNGIAYRQCLLVSVYPDSSNTYCGKVIRQDGNVIEFDVDLDTPEYSSWNDVTNSYREWYEKNKAAKPWLREVVAYNLFYELMRQGKPC